MTSTAIVSFDRDIKPLFSEIDIDHMSGHFDLSKFEDVRDNSQSILSHLKSTGIHMMPPASAGGPWSADKISLFEKWISDGRQP
jgi:hypothetical protein